MNSKHAWGVIAAFVIAWEYLCREDEFLSDQARRWNAKNPWVWRGLILSMAAHLGEFVPREADPIHLLFVLLHKTGIKRLWWLE